MVREASGRTCKPKRVVRVSWESLDEILCRWPSTLTSSGAFLASLQCAGIKSEWSMFKASILWAFHSRKDLGRDLGVCPTSLHVLCSSGEGLWFLRRYCGSCCGINGWGAHYSGPSNHCMPKTRAVFRFLAVSQTRSQGGLPPPGCTLSPIMFVIFMDRISRRSCGWVGRVAVRWLFYRLHQEIILRLWLGALSFPVISYCGTIFLQSFVGYRPICIICSILSSPTSLKC